MWSRRSTSSFRRNAPQHGQPSMRQRIMTNLDKLNRRATDQYNKLTPVQKVLFVVGNLALCVLGILFLVYNEKIFGSLMPYAKKWRDIRAGWLILWALIFVVSFPPLIGYSSLLTIAGFVYGFPNGYVFSPLIPFLTPDHSYADMTSAGSSPQQQPSQAAPPPLSSRAPSSKTLSTASSQTTSASLRSP